MHLPDSASRRRAALAAPTKLRPVDVVARRSLLRGFAAAMVAAGLAPLGALAQPRGGRIVVPYPPGGPTDVLARLLLDGYQRALGTTFVVENRPGATGNIGAAEVARATPDGNTLLLTNTAIVMNPVLFTRTPVVDPFKELTPVSALGSTAFALVVPAPAAAPSLRAWLERMRQKPAVFYGSFGIGSSNHLFAHDFAAKASLAAQHVPYKGDAPVLQDLLGGQLDFAFMAVGSAKRVGDRVQVLAVTGEARGPQFPDAPTLKELGIAGFETSGWLGLFAPAGTPIDKRRAIARTTVDVLNTPEAREQLAQFGLQVFGTTPERFEEMVQAEATRQAARIKASGARLD